MEKIHAGAVACTSLSSVELFSTMWHSIQNRYRLSTRHGPGTISVVPSLGQREKLKVMRPFVRYPYLARTSCESSTLTIVATIERHYISAEITESTVEVDCVKLAQISVPTGSYSENMTVTSILDRSASRLPVELSCVNRIQSISPSPRFHFLLRTPDSPQNLQEHIPHPLQPHKTSTVAPHH